MRSRDHISRFSAFDWPLFVCRALDFEMDSSAGSVVGVLALCPSSGYTLECTTATPLHHALWVLGAARLQHRLSGRFRCCCRGCGPPRRRHSAANGRRHCLRQPSGANTADTQLGGGQWNGASRLCKPTDCILTAPADCGGLFLTRMVNDVRVCPQRIGGHAGTTRLRGLYFCLLASTLT